MPVSWGLLALAGGMLALRWMPALPAAGTLLLQAVLGLILLRGRLWPLGLFLLGLAWACIGARIALDDRLDPALDGEIRWLEGQVAGLPAVAEGVTRFELGDVRSPRAELPRASSDASSRALRARCSSRKARMSAWMSSGMA